MPTWDEFDLALFDDEHAKVALKTSLAIESNPLDDDVNLSYSYFDLQFYLYELLGESNNLSISHKCLKNKFYVLSKDWKTQWREQKT